VLFIGPGPTTIFQLSEGMVAEGVCAVVCLHHVLPRPLPSIVPEVCVCPVGLDEEVEGALVAVLRSEVEGGVTAMRPN